MLGNYTTSKARAGRALFASALAQEPDPLASVERSPHIASEYAGLGPARRGADNLRSREHEWPGTSPDFWRWASGAGACELIVAGVAIAPLEPGHLGCLSTYWLEFVTLRAAAYREQLPTSNDAVSHWRCSRRWPLPGLLEACLCEADRFLGQNGRRDWLAFAIRHLGLDLLEDWRASLATPEEE